MLPPIVTTTQLATELKRQGQTGRGGQPIHPTTLWRWGSEADSPWSRCIARRTKHKTWWRTDQLIAEGLLPAPRPGSSKSQNEHARVLANARQAVQAAARLLQQLDQSLATAQAQAPASAPDRKVRPSSLPPTIPTSRLVALLKAQGSPVSHSTLWRWSCQSSERNAYAACVVVRTGRNLTWSTPRLIAAGLLKDAAL